MPHNRYVGIREKYREARCVKCGRGWVIARQAVIPAGGYVCPWCEWREHRKEVKPG